MQLALRVRRKRKGEGAALPLAALDRYVPAVGQDNVLGNSQAQARTAAPPRPVHLVEPLKDVREVLLRDSHAVVSDPNPEHLILGVRGKHHPTPGLCELQGVV